MSPRAAEPSSDTTVEDLFRDCERRLGKFLAQLVRDRALAEDLLQETFHDAFRARGQLIDVRNPEAWLFGIARNLALASLRRRRRFQGALGRLSRHLETEHSETDLLQVRDLLERHLAPTDRALLLLRYFHGFDANELSRMTGMTPAAVRQRLSRARSTLLAASETAVDPDTNQEGG